MNLFEFVFVHIVLYSRLQIINIIQVGNCLSFTNRSIKITVDCKGFLHD